MGRLDFILVSETLLGNCRKESIVPGFRSDHSAVDVTLVFNEVKRGKTFWKFNSTLLKNINYVKEIKLVILNVKKQYAASPYNLEMLNEINNKHFHPIITPQLFFEILLLEIRSKTIAFSTAIKKDENKRLEKLESEILSLENSDPGANFDLIKEKQSELNDIREHRLKGTLLRSRARWIEKSEKPSNYFLNLENRNFVSKQMRSLTRANGEDSFFIL